MASNIFGLHSQQAAYLDCIFRRLCNIFGRNNPCILHASDARNCSSKHSMHVSRVNGEKNSVYCALVKEEGVCLTSLPSPLTRVLMSGEVRSQLQEECMYMLACMCAQAAEKLHPSLHVQTDYDACINDAFAAMFLICSLFIIAN